MGDEGPDIEAMDASETPWGGTKLVDEEGKEMQPHQLK